MSGRLVVCGYMEKNPEEEIASEQGE